MESENYRIIKIFDDGVWSINLKNELHTFPGQAPENLYIDAQGNEKINWDGLAGFYNIPTQQRNNKEKVLVITNPQTMAEEGLNGKWLTSYDIFKFKGKDCPFNYGTLCGITTTKDNQVVFGLRSGEITPERTQKYASGLFGTVPTGLITFNNKAMDIIKLTAEHELTEELGNFNFRYGGLVGIFEAYKPGPGGIKIVSLSYVDTNLSELQLVNLEANYLQKSMEKDKAPKKEIEKALKNKGLPVDAWEHTSLNGVKNNSESIEDLVNNLLNSFAAVGSGALMTYAKMIKTLSL